jgi:hypothetical protein
VLIEKRFVLSILSKERESKTEIFYSLSPPGNPKNVICTHPPFKKFS